MIRAWLGEGRFKQSTFLYLASSVGGDASVLAAMGIPACKQMAVDVDPDALAKFSEVYPDVPTFNGSLAKVPGKYDVVFADLCGRLSNKSLEALKDAFKLIRANEDSVFGYAILRGRDGDFNAERASVLSKVKADLGRQKKTFQILKYTDDPLADYDPRFGVIYKKLIPLMKRRMIRLDSIGRILYHSRGSTSGGVPMGIKLYRVHLATSRKKVLVRDKSWFEYAKTFDEAMRISIAMDAGETQMLVEDPKALEIAKVGYAYNLTGYEENAYLAEAIEVCEVDGMDAAKCFNLPKAKLAALKAHWSRGSYDHIEPPDNGGSEIFNKMMALR